MGTVSSSELMGCGLAFQASMPRGRLKADKPLILYCVILCMAEYSSSLDELDTGETIRELSVTSLSEPDLLLVGYVLLWLCMVKCLVKIVRNIYENYCM